jgi:hypothetical protein
MRPYASILYTLGGSPGEAASPGGEFETDSLINLRYSVYLLYYYKSTHTDNAHQSQALEGQAAHSGGAVQTPGA